MWNWHDGKIALEYLFYAGRVAVAGRINFERIYDSPERVLPAEVLGQPEMPEAEAQRQLVRIAAQALGIATEPDLGDYFRLPRAASKARVAELVETGELIPVEVDGWAQPAYLWPAAQQPRTVNARALLSPFDSLVWYRERAERLFGFQYRVEIYTPAPKRRYGYYVLPFLLGDTLVARVDLKSDRKAGLLLVQGAFAEEGADQSYVAGELAAELRDAATWQRRRRQAPRRSRSPACRSHPMNPQVGRRRANESGGRSATSQLPGSGNRAVPAVKNDIPD